MATFLYIKVHAGFFLFDFFLFCFVFLRDVGKWEEIALVPLPVHISAVDLMALHWDSKLSFFFSFPECQNYQVLSNADRKVTNNARAHLCDNTLGPAWFRFQGDAGTKMPTSCTPQRRCGTSATGWLNGKHPEKHEGNVTRQVCFHWYSNCCEWSVNIHVQNCSGYYLYYINGTYSGHPCHLRFCGTD